MPDVPPLGRIKHSRFMASARKTLPSIDRPKVLVVHGPNLNLLGEREAGIYGAMALADIDRNLHTLADELELEITTFQSNSEGALVDRIQAVRRQIALLIINPAAYTHTSVAIRDVILAIGVPCIEVHLSNVYKREAFRHHSTIADIVAGRIMGFGPDSYMIALRAAKNLIAAARGAD
jgi:3-dehydroquinate dehydratase-2